MFQGLGCGHIFLEVTIQLTTPPIIYSFKLYTLILIMTHFRTYLLVFLLSRFVVVKYI